MDIDNRLKLSFYRTVANIREDHHIYLVQHTETKKFFVRKDLSVYNKSIYDLLKTNPIHNTPQIIEIIENESILSIIEEYIPGQTVQEILDNGYRFSESEVISYTIQLCDILKEFHEFTPPVIHRDIKPSNIIITSDQILKLLDFNAAKHSSEEKEEDTTLIGTKGYAAPEQYGFGISTATTDIYSVGILMNTMLTGNSSHNCNIESKLGNIIRQCISLEPLNRYQSAEDLKNALISCQSDNDTQVVRNWKELLPPGFRDLNPLHMLLGGFGYMFIFWLSLSLNVNNASTNLILWLNRFCCLAGLLSIVAVSCNYMDIQRFLPLTKAKNSVIRIIAIIVWDILFFLFAALLLVILESVLK